MLKELHQQELELAQKVLGKEHPNTLTSMHSLTIVLSRQDKYNQAKEIH